MKDVMTPDVATRVVAIVAEQAMVPVSEVTLDTDPADLGVDSMGLVEAIFAIEEAFDVQVPFNANDPGASDFDTSSVGAIVAAVERLMAEQHGA